MSSKKQDKGKQRQKGSVLKINKQKRRVKRNFTHSIDKGSQEIKKSKRNIQKQVRQRERFKCAFCGSIGTQYAHIIPDSHKGEYSLENIILLCYTHHSWLEPARAKGVQYSELIKVMETLRDQNKTDGILNETFLWTKGEELIVSLGGGFEFINTERILESENHPERPYLSISTNDFGLMELTAYFDDENGEFMSIIKNRLSIDTSNAWDIVIERRRLLIEHHSKVITLEITQSENSELQIKGKLYLNGGYFEIKSDRITDLRANNTFCGNKKSNSQGGLLLKPGGFAF